ncbi:MAG: hypothetical protein L0Y39_10790 [Methylococcaceae bacterium]|nr:hypothetical protein [Methylococcaceae bacterium]
MLRITTICDDPTSANLLVEGRIALEWVALLESEIKCRLASGKSVELDFAGVDFIDGSGIRMLRSLSCPRLTISRDPAFIRALLKAPG